MVPKLTANQKELIEKEVMGSKDKEIIKKAIEDAKKNLEDLPNKKDSFEETGSRFFLDLISFGLYETTIDHSKDKIKEEQNLLYKETQKEFKKHNP